MSFKDLLVVAEELFENSGSVITVGDVKVALDLDKRSILAQVSANKT